MLKRKVDLSYYIFNLPILVLHVLARKKYLGISLCLVVFFSHLWLIFIARQHACSTARYCFTIYVRPSVCRVGPSRCDIVSK